MHGRRVRCVRTVARSMSDQGDRPLHVQYGGRGQETKGDEIILVLAEDTSHSQGTSLERSYRSSHHVES